MREKIKYVAGEIKWQLGRFARWLKDENNAWKILVLLTAGANIKLYVDVTCLGTKLIEIIGINQQLIELFTSIFT